MRAIDTPFKTLEKEQSDDALHVLLARPRSPAANMVPAAALGAVLTARLHSFDLCDAPVLGGFARAPGELIAARTAVPLRREQIGATVLVLHEEGDWTRPIVVGVLQDRVSDPLPVVPARFDVQADGERLTLSAEREIVLRCGQASITLTRSGKVVIRGRYVLSRSSGYNKIKGAAVGIN
ncbi:MAG: DUF6484 domain-containing protein [Polyangiaceae bacterium]|nr:DUF6484 domain-containing protein [Polyangiaceae bacterium]